MAPFTNPTSTHKLLVSITLAVLASMMTGSNPSASSGETLDALGPVCTALMVAIGCPVTYGLIVVCLCADHVHGTCYHVRLLVYAIFSCY